MYHILFGFDDEATVKSIIRIIKKQTHQNEIDYSIQTTKDAIEEYIKYNKDCDTIVLREVMDGESWSAEELAELNDWKTYNIVVVIDKTHKGTEFTQVLYTAGITNAFLVENGAGVSAGEIAHYIINPRSRASARKVYGMNSLKVPVNVLTSDMYVKHYSYLMDESQGTGLIDRYLMTVRNFSTKIAVDFTKKLPTNLLNKLCEYEEFWKVYEHFIACGFKLNFKRPKTLRKGMSDDEFKNLLKKPKKGESKKTVIPEEYRKTTFKEEVADDALNKKEQENEYFDNMMSLFDDMEVSNKKPVKIENTPKENASSDSVSNTVVKKKKQQFKSAGQKNVSTEKKATVKTESNKKKSGTKEKKSKKEQEVKPVKVKKSINWKIVAGIFGISCLLLIIFYLMIRMQLI